MTSQLFFAEQTFAFPPAPGLCPERHQWFANAQVRPSPVPGNPAGPAHEKPWHRRPTVPLSGILDLPLKALVDRDIQKERQVGCQTPRCKMNQVLQRSNIRLVTVTLISQGRIAKAVADHNFFLIQRRAKDLRNVLGGAAWKSKISVWGTIETFFMFIKTSRI